MWSDKLLHQLRTYRSVIYFMLVVVSAHFFWKFSIDGTDTDTTIGLWGFDISKPFLVLTSHVAQVVAFILQSIGFEIKTYANNVIQHTNNTAVRIVWSCTGLKQAFIFTCLIGLYKGEFFKKLWFIPLGLLVVYLINIIRITSISALVKFFPNQFELMHEYIFKYLFYVALFGLWVLWDEKITSQKPKYSDADQTADKG